MKVHCSDLKRYYYNSTWSNWISVTDWGKISQINVVVVDPSPWQLGKQEDELDCIKLLLCLLWETLFIQWEARHFVLQSVCHLKKWTPYDPCIPEGSNFDARTPEPTETGS